MRRLAGAPCIVTTRLDDMSVGLVATAVTSLSAEPPRLLACVNKTASAHDTIVRAGFFAINVLSAGDETTVRSFNSCAREERFNHGSWRASRTGAPLLETAMAAFDCRTHEAVSMGSHTIFIGDVVDILVGDDADPLIYFDGDFRNLNLVADRQERNMRPGQVS